MYIFRQIFLWAILIFLHLANAKACNSNGCSQVRGFFIFGDSLVDNGNNNDMLTLARADYSPYGVDFSDGATGRFTNGRTFVDVLGNSVAFYPLHDHEFLRILHFDDILCLFCIFCSSIVGVP